MGKYRLQQDIGVVTATNDVCFGKPRIKGTRVPTKRVYRMYENGGLEQVLEEFPELDKKDVLAAVKYEMGINEIG